MGFLMISAEIEDKLKADEGFLRSTMAVVVREMILTWGVKVEIVAAELGVPVSTVSSWLTEETLPEPNVCWVLIEKFEESVPIEWIIRGVVLDQYNVTEKISRVRDFIVAATDRIEKDGYFNDSGARAVDLTVEKGELSHFGILSSPGPHKIWLQLTLTEELLNLYFERIGSDEATVGGLSGRKLPRLPDNLDATALSSIERHPYEGTVRDWEEMARWAPESSVR